MIFPNLRKHHSIQIDIVGKYTQVHSKCLMKEVKYSKKIKKNGLTKETGEILIHNYNK